MIEVEIEIGTLESQDSGVTDEFYVETAILVPARGEFNSKSPFARYLVLVGLEFAHNICMDVPFKASPKCESRASITGNGVEGTRA